MIPVNPERRCSLCEANRLRLGLPAQSEPPPRVGVFDPEAKRLRVLYMCPTHDFAGPVVAYPAHVAEVQR